MDYKDTLNLPQTTFPMRGNLPQREPEVLARWLKEELYQRVLRANAGNPSYVLHDGPPYANGDVHLGTALNKIIKDVVVKRQLMGGRNAPYIPGWDCHGMPIEHQVLRQLGASARTMSQLEIRRRCRAYAEKYVDVQRKQFQRLGVFGDWDNPYLSMSPDYEAAIVRMFRRLAESGFIYRGLRPVHWCPTCATALAEAELEYSEHTSPSIYVRFRFAGSADDARALATSAADADTLAAAVAQLSVVIWTTTPWTLPANLGVCFNPHLDYVAVQVGDEYMIVASRLVDAFFEATQLKGRDGRRIPVNLTAIDGKDLLRHPFIDRTARILFESHVTAEAGTGCVHTAPGHGYEDFSVGQKYDLPVLTPVDAAGRFTAEAGAYQGRKVFESNDDIVNELRANGSLVHGEQLAHSYPHCWRSKDPLIFRATEQWFLRIDHADLRPHALAEIDRTTWTPRWGRDRIYNMMEGRPDWCLSRQRAWGVPIPAFHCKKCDRHHAEPELIRHVEDVFAARGSDAWYELPVNELLPPGYTCECGSADLETDTNILDVWFDSACSHDAVLNGRKLGWPADLYVEAVDQHRGWFQVSLITAVATEERAPYRGVLTHGLILDANARKMSKSLGNTIAPDEVIKKYGADILRLLFCSVDFTADTCFSQNLITPLLESYRKIRNTCRFLLGNLNGFDPQQHTVPFAELPELDRWIIQRSQRLLTRCLDAYDQFAFHHIVQGVTNFCAVDLSALYLDIAKDRLYCSAAHSVERRASQTALFHTLDFLVRVIAPILPFTADEIWSYVPGQHDATVFEAGLPQPNPELIDETLAQTWDRLLDVRAEVTKALEETRKNGAIGHSLDARVTLAPNEDLRALLEPRLRELPALFIVSQVELAPPHTNRGLAIEVEKARGEKCERCWNFSEAVGRDREHPGLCDRCARVVKAAATEGQAASTT